MSCSLGCASQARSPDIDILKSVVAQTVRESAQWLDGNVICPPLCHLDDLGGIPYFVFIDILFIQFSFLMYYKHLLNCVCIREL